MRYIDQPYAVAGLTLNNRLVFPPMASGTPSLANQVTELTLRHYAKRAKGGCIGLMIAEHAFVAKDGMAAPKQLSAAEDRDIEGLARLAKAMRADGTKAVAQISHAGGATKRLFTGRPTLGPSRDTTYAKIQPDIEMSQEDIHRVTAQFAAAAGRAKAAGFDGVEIHSAHGYLLDQFYSPLTNTRADEYGGSLDHRIRFHLEVVAAVRAAVGDDFPLLLRLGACDYLPGGSTLEDGVAAALRFEQAGVDLLDISGGLCFYTVRGREKEQGYFRDASTAIKRAVRIPVLLTGGVTDLQAADQLIADGCADLIGVGRSIFKDAAWAAKAMAAR